MFKKFEEVFEGKVIKEGVNEEKRMVVAGVLEGDALSENGRFYPLGIVEMVSKTLVGKPSLVGHDTDSPGDIVARISHASMSGKKIVASFQFGKDSHSETIFQKVKEGLIDSYSIRAFGTTKPGVVEGQDVDIVQSLDIATVDLVVEGGIKSAKVLRVFESAPKFEIKQEESMTEEQKKQFEEMQEKIKVYEAEKVTKEAELAESKKKTEEAELKGAESRLKLHVEKKLATIADADLRKLVLEALTGKTEEEVNKQFEAQVAILKKATEGKNVILRPVDGDKGGSEINSLSEALMGDKTTREDKADILRALMGVKKAA